MAQTFTSNYGQLAKDKGADIITKVDDALTKRWTYYYLIVLMVHLTIAYLYLDYKNKTKR